MVKLNIKKAPREKCDLPEHFNSAVFIAPGNDKLYYKPAVGAHEFFSPGQREKKRPLAMSAKPSRGLYRVRYHWMIVWRAFARSNPNTRIRGYGHVRNEQMVDNSSLGGIGRISMLIGTLGARPVMELEPTKRGRGVTLVVGPSARTRVCPTRASGHAREEGEWRACIRMCTRVRRARFLCPRRDSRCGTRPSSRYPTPRRVANHCNEKQRRTARQTVVRVDRPAKTRFH